MRRGTTVGVVGMIAALAAGCAAGADSWGVAPSASVTTAMPGFTENWFRVEWKAEPDPAGSRRIWGYVYNTYGRPAADMRILVQALDSANNVVAQRLERMGRPVPPDSRAYFEVRGMPPADQYRVSVWSYTIIDDGAGQPFP